MSTQHTTVVTVDGTLVRALEELRDCMTKWRATPCSFPRVVDGEVSEERAADDDLCDGENHREDCAVELAWQDMIAIHNKLAPDAKVQR